MKLRKKIWITAGSILFTILVVLPLTAIAVVKWAILPPDKLTPIVLGYINPMVDGRIDCESIELTFWETFPRVGLRLTGGEIISYALKDSTARANGQAEVSDSLLTFSRAVVSVDIMDYIKRNRLTIDRLGIDDPFFYGCIDQSGRANWDIFIDTSEVEEMVDTTSFDFPIIDLQKFRIRNGRFIFDDDSSDIYAETRGFDLRMRNTLSKGNLNVDLTAGFGSLAFESPDYALGADLRMNLESVIDLYRGKIVLSNTTVNINDVPIRTSGTVEKADGNHLLDFDFELEVPNIADLVGFIPAEYFKSRDKVDTKGALTLAGRIEGLYGGDVMPDLTLTCLLDKGQLQSKRSGRGIERLDADLDIRIDNTSPELSYVAFRRLAMKGTNTSFDASGRVARIFTDPYIDTRLKGRIDFTSIMQDILNPDSMVIKGIMDADIEAAFRLNDITAGDYSRIKAAGTFELDRALISNRAAGLGVFMRGVHFSADTTTQSSRFLTDGDLFTAYLKVDTMNVRYGEDIRTGIGNLDMQIKTSRTIDTTAVTPVTTHIRMASLRARLPDSVWVAGRNFYLAGGIKASDTDRKKPVFAGVVTMDTMRYFDVPLRTGATVDKPVFSLQVTPMRDVRRQRRLAAAAAEAEAGLHLAAHDQSPDSPEGSGQSRAAAAERRRRADNTDSEGRVSGDSLSRRRRSREPRPDETETQKLLRNWEVKGTVKFDRARGFTGMFPLRLSMDKTTLRFDTDKITLTDAVLRAGNSDFTLSGDITNIRRTMLRGDTLQARLSLGSGYIDFNQLTRAINQSSVLSETGAVESEPQDEETMFDNWDDDRPDTVSDDDQFDGIIVIPANIDLVLDTRADKVDFNDLNLENISGQVIVRNQTVNLRRLNVDSNVGSGRVTMVYMAKDRSKAHAGFELELEDIIVEELIGMFPSIDSLLPMLRSFEGVLDCQMSATCELDSMMNVVLPTLHSACYLSGENMVLMDGETFSEISKKLMFKNKDRNLIDYISVDLSIKDNKIEVFPFMVELDRYRLAVGGLHNLDMTFDYHISVLKSPVPFKLGIDVRGHIDDFKFKVVKCRYKNIFTPTREQELEDIRLNLRSAIRESIRRQLMENAPELGEDYSEERIRSRRPEAMVTDTDDEEELTDDQLEQIDENSEMSILEQIAATQNPDMEEISDIHGSTRIEAVPEKAADTKQKKKRRERRKTK